MISPEVDSYLPHSLDRARQNTFANREHRRKHTSQVASRRELSHPELQEIVQEAAKSQARYSDVRCHQSDEIPGAERFINSQNHGEFSFVLWPPPRKASGLHVALTAGHLSAANSALQPPHRTWDRRRRPTVSASGLPSSFR